MKCILTDCENEAIDKKLHFITKKQYEEGFRFCQEHWDKTQKYNLERLIESLKMKILKFNTDWSITDADFVKKKISSELEKFWND